MSQQEWHREHVETLVEKEKAEWARVEARQARLKTLIADVEVGLPRCLAAVGELKAEVRALEKETVQRARSQGWAWAEIARVLGVSRQVIHRRYVSGTPKKKPQKKAPQEKAAKAQKATK